MSLVSNYILITSVYAPTKTAGAIARFNDKHLRGHCGFTEVSDHAGGYKAIEWYVHMYAGNYIDPEDMRAWVDAHDWGTSVQVFYADQDDLEWSELTSKTDPSTPKTWEEL